MYSIGVIGGGLIGVCCALSLQRAGHAVTLIEKTGVASGASFGNAGIMSSGGCVPLALPGVLLKVPKMLLNQDSPLAIRWTYFPTLFPWLIRFIAAARPKQVESISIALHSLLVKAHEAFDDLLGPVLREKYIVNNGLLVPFSSEKSFEASIESRRIRARRGVKFQLLDQSSLVRIEPCLSENHVSAVYFEEARHVLDPHRLTEELIAEFQKTGGVVLIDEVSQVEDRLDRSTIITCNGHTQKFDRIVLAAGAWSKRFAAMVGCRVPLDTERGYHVMLPNPGVDVQRPMIFSEHGIAVTPMRKGLRISGLVEFAGLSAPPDFRRAQRMLSNAAMLLPGLNVENPSFWMGHRPSLPDSKPIIGRAHKNSNVFLAFGHGHQGVGFAAITGRLIETLINGEELEVEMSPFAPNRFRGFC